MPGEPDPTERVIKQLTNNAELHCARFCLYNCGIYGEAQHRVVVVSAMAGNAIVAANLSEETPTIETKGQGELPQLVLTCKGPRKQFWIAGKLVCRDRATINKI